MPTTACPFTWYDKGIKHIKPEIFLSEDIKVALIATGYTPNAATHEYFDVSITNELGTANGYTAGGLSLTTKTLVESPAGTWTFSSDNPSWSVVTANLVAKMFVLYNNTPSSSKPLLAYGYLDWNSGTPNSVTTTPSNILNILLPVNGWFTSIKVNG